MGEKKCKNSQLSEVEDRLSSLPDAILIDNILSRLETHKAASTSVLSRRWRHLWTSINRIDFQLFNDKGDEFRSSDDTAIVDIIRNLTSPKLTVFEVHVVFLLVLKPDERESCFRELGRRNVETITMYVVDEETYDKYLFEGRPTCLFEIQSLVTLEFYFFFKLPDNAPVIKLPNLKKLCLSSLTTFPSWLGELFRSSPLLEHLDLRFDVDWDPNEPYFDVKIFAPSLKSFYMRMHSPCKDDTRIKIFIDAPALKVLEIIDSSASLDYYFVQKPTLLRKAFITSTVRGTAELGWMAVNNREEYMQQLSKFVAGMSSVRKLCFSLDHKSQNNIYKYLYSMNHRPLAIFPCLNFLDIAWYHGGINGLKDLLLSLHCFPNLNHLKLCLNNHRLLKRGRAPDSIPKCMVSKLMKLEIMMQLDVMGDKCHESSLLAYILSNAIVLEKLYLSHVSSRISEAQGLWNACNFCRSLFMLPRGSSSCEIVFSNTYMRASSNGFKNGSLTCEVFHHG